MSGRTLSAAVLFAVLLLLLNALANGQASDVSRARDVLAPDITPTPSSTPTPSPTLRLLPSISPTPPPPSPTPTVPAFQVSFIDVGQGDSALLRATDGTDVLIDGGPRSAGPTLVAYLQSEGIDDVEVLVLTHADAEHVGGLIDVLQSAIHVESVFYNGQHGASLAYQEFLAETQQRGLTPVAVQAGQTFSWGQISASVLNPQAALEADQNENSVVLLVVYGETRFFFGGDIGSSTEQTLLESVTGTLTLRQQLPADVLKVAGHGDGSSSSAAFLEAVGAEVAVISVGARNPYEHPAQETLDRLRAAGAQVLRTDQNGTIVIATGGQTYEVYASFVIFLPSMRSAPPTVTPTPSNTPTGTPPTPTPTITPRPT